MKTIMSLEQLTTLDAIKQFLEGTQAVVFNVVTDKSERYRWVQKTLVKHRYLLLGKADRGTVTRYLMKVTGYSLAQTKRLIRQYVKTGTVSVKPARRNGFKRAYTEADIGLLASMDERHGQPSGPVLKKLCERAYQLFDQSEYHRLAGISVSHLYNLRASKTYQRQRCILIKTRPKSAPIGQRRKPCPNDQPGYIRIDSVHQGDQDKRKGVYHVNAVDEVTQFQIIATLERISEEFMLPALNQILAAFPFKIKGFHADNGSEYINYTVAELLDKLCIEFTKSRSRHSNDNGLVEGKNGSVVRKLYGYMHIPQQYAADFTELNRRQVYRYVNFHRPCYFPSIIVDSKGKQRKKYRYNDMMTPYEKFRSLAKPSQYLKPGVTFKKTGCIRQ
jgi:transposase InsO family protein